ncbi:MAG: hypothetical protein ABR999_04390 [Methanoregula sp.]|jgi:hypothetical protein|uniref:hypothetical protein n=1 Tax=Methanoregula sp. TaxID=2052170 RepID=UPI003D0D482D
MANAGYIIVGICIIGALYFLPVTTVQVPNFFGPSTQVSLTVSSISSLCSNTIVAALGGSSCQMYVGAFYIGWIVGIVLILYGLMRR